MDMFRSAVCALGLGISPEEEARYEEIGASTERLIADLSIKVRAVEIIAVSAKNDASEAKAVALGSALALEPVKTIAVEAKAVALGSALAVDQVKTIAVEAKAVALGSALAVDQATADLRAGLAGLAQFREEVRADISAQITELKSKSACYEVRTSTVTDTPVDSTDVSDDDSAPEIAPRHPELATVLFKGKHYELGEFALAAGFGGKVWAVGNTMVAKFFNRQHELGLEAANATHLKDVDRVEKVLGIAEASGGREVLIFQRRCGDLKTGLLESLRSSKEGAPPTKTLHIKVRLGIAIQIISVLWYVHENGLLHGDFHLQQVLFDENKDGAVVVFLTDLSNAHAPGIRNPCEYSRYYSSGDVETSTASDVFSLGTSLLEWFDDEPQGFYQKQRKDQKIGETDRKHVKDFPPHLWDLLQQCRTDQAWVRPTMETLYFAFEAALVALDD